MAEPSVAENTPPMMPPMTTMIRDKEGRARTVSYTHLRQILQECARASAQYERQLWAQEETTAREAALAGGCRELPLPEEEMQNFRQLVQPLYQKYCADYLPVVEEIQRN